MIKCLKTVTHGLISRNGIYMQSEAEALNFVKENSLFNQT